jgi:hypothetical protein
MAERSLERALKRVDEEIKARDGLLRQQIRRVTVCRPKRVLRYMEHIARSAARNRDWILGLKGKR